MHPFADCLMALLCGLLLWLGHTYIPMPALINLLFNVFMLALIVLYIMQSLGVIKKVLPTPTLFK